MVIFIFMQMIVLCCCAPNLTEAFEKMQSAFNFVQSQFHQLRLVLNVEKLY